MTAYVCITQEPGSTVVIEEPEANLHPAAQRSLLAYLREWAANRVILMSSHSTVFVEQSTQADACTWLTERHGSTSSVRRADTELPAILHAVGVRLTDLLSAERLWLVEGESDVDIYRAWFPDRFAGGAAAIAPLEGGDKAWHVEMIDDVFRAADELDRKIVFVRDRDEMSAENLQKLSRVDGVHVLIRRELENYLLDPDAILAVLTEREADSGSQVTGSLDRSGIEMLIAEAADRLLEATILKAVIDQLVPIRIIDRRQRKALVAAGAGMDQLLAQVESSLPVSGSKMAEARGLWTDTERTIRHQWDEHKLERAPGAEILDAVWKAHGGRYDKRRDGPRIAAAMHPPAEVTAILHAFLAD